MSYLKSPLQLEFINGYVGKYRQSLVFTDDANIVAYPIGSNIWLHDTSKKLGKHKLLSMHDANVSAIDIDTKNNLLASGQCVSSVTGAGIVLIWEYKRKKIISSVGGFKKDITSVRFSPDGRFLAISDAELMVVVKPENGEVQLAKRVKDNKINSLVWCSQMLGNDGHEIYVLAQIGKEIQIHTLKYDASRMSYGMTTQYAQTSNYSRSFIDGVSMDSRLNVLSDAGEIFEMDWRKPSLMNDTGIKGIKSISKHGNDIYYGKNDGTVESVSHLRQTKTYRNMIGKLPITSLSISSNSFIGGCKGLLFKYSMANYEVVWIRHSHIAPVISVAYEQMDTFGTLSEAFSDRSGELCVWSVADYELLGKFTRNSKVGGSCVSIITDNDGKPIFVTGWKDGSIKGHNLEDGSLKWTLPQAHRSAVTCIKSHNNWIITAGEDGLVRTWDKNGRRFLSNVKFFKGAIRAITLEMIGRELVVHACGDDHILDNRKLSTCKSAYSNRHLIAKGGFNGVCQVKNRDKSINRLITVDTNSNICVWDVDQASYLKRVTDISKHPLNCIALSPNKQYIAVGGDDCTIKVYDLELELIGSRQTHSKSIINLCWSYDSTQIISVAKDCSVAVHNFFAV